MLDRSAAQPSGADAETKPVLAHIQIYPVKSLDAVDVQRARVLPSGALEHDRAWALFDETGGFINGKRYAAVHRLRSSIDLASRSLTLREGTDPHPPEATFHIEHGRPELESWLARYFGVPVSLRKNDEVGFPDDPESPGPTLISTATLTEIGRWFGLSLDDVRRRFRTNIEIGGVPPFWEDRLFGSPGTTVRFRIGNVLFNGINPCQRCVVPPRDALTGQGDDTFVRRFAELRQRTLPDWSTRERFNHFYRVAINTRLASLDQGDSIEIGDEIEILEPPPAQHKPSLTISTPAQEYWSGELIVDEVKIETPSVKTLRLRNPEGALPFSFEAGQFVTVSVKHGSELLQRCYTLSSSPSQKDYCEITIKREGRASARLHEVCVPGSHLTVAGPMGHFTLKTSEARPLVMIAGGVGITPLMSKLRFLRDTKAGAAVDLIYSVKSEHEVIFRQELHETSLIADNIRVHLTVTGDDPGWTGGRGRLTSARIVALIPDIATRSVHLCGPVDMASAIQEMLRELGVEESKIEIEAFGGPSPLPAITDDSEHDVRFAKSGSVARISGAKTILDAALAEGIALDHGCHAGVCGRCKTLLLAGEVRTGCDLVLTPEQKARGHILACQSRPAGPLVVDL